MSPKHKTPDKPGIYYTYWNSGTYLSFFDGNAWCNGAWDGVSLEEFKSRLYRELLGTDVYLTHTIPYVGPQILYSWDLVEEWSA